MTPFHRLSTPLTRAWAINRDARHKLAAWLARTYPKTGVAVCTDTLSVVAWVNPLAQIKFATPPFQRVERHQCANNPTWRDCECQRWFDPESGGAWGKREAPLHHPLCIFDPGAKRRWRELDKQTKTCELDLPSGTTFGNESLVGCAFRGVSASSTSGTSASAPRARWRPSP